MEVFQEEEEIQVLQGEEEEDREVSVHTLVTVMCEGMAMLACKGIISTQHTQRLGVGGHAEREGEGGKSSRN